MQNIGYLSLNLSFAIYVIWFLPQLYLNFKRKDTEGLSIYMHGILYLAYLADFLYGFGRDMQWQYRIVTVIGFLSLTVQHYQFFRYGLHTNKEKLTFTFLSIFCLLLSSLVVWILLFGELNQSTADIAGMITNVCWLSYMIPQIIQNHQHQSAKGLSFAFVCLSIFLNVCDSTSAWMLGWDYPSKIGPAIAFLGNLILIVQLRYFHFKHHASNLS